jgi:hypothetical protein
VDAVQQPSPDSPSPRFPRDWFWGEPPATKLTGLAERFPKPAIASTKTSRGAIRVAYSVLEPQALGTEPYLRLRKRRQLPEVPADNLVGHEAQPCVSTVGFELSV